MSQNENAIGPIVEQYNEIKSQVLNILHTRTNCTIILYGPGNNGKSYLRHDLHNTGVIDSDYQRSNNIIIETNILGDSDSYDYHLPLPPDNREIIIDMSHISF